MRLPVSNTAFLYSGYFKTCICHKIDNSQDKKRQRYKDQGKKKKRIVFINIDGSPLTNWFEFMFGTKQHIDASSEVLMDKLCKDLTKWLK
jgi:hypothetical protein